MEQIKTDDGSATFYSEEYGEHYHSTSGAVEEAVKKFAEPCRIAELAKKGSISILDICFGIGYNSAAAIDAALETNPNCNITIFALENDEKILESVEDLHPVFKNYDAIKEAAKYHIFSKGRISITILLGDARETILNANDEFDAVFLDPFSPKKCPELWTEEFFRDIFSTMKKGAILATYSCARSVRENLKKAGFEVKDGPVVGRKSPATVAIK